MTAIGDYFRTALLIDDRIESDYRPLEELQVDPLDSAATEPAPGLVAPPEDDQTPVYPSELVSAFLAEGIVCSVIEPSEDGSDLLEMALSSAQIADLLILDWLMHGSSAPTVNAIKEVSETCKDRLTVIVVFTGNDRLMDVVDELMDDANFEQLDEFVLRHTDTIVLIFGKPGITLGEGEQVRTATYAELPSMIRADLEWVFKGLMPEFAFRGITQLRESAPRVLATCSASLDAGALAHRALLPEPSDAGPQFIRLLVSEFEQSLSEARIGDVWDIESSNDSLARQLDAGNPANLATKLRSAETTDSSLRELEDDELVREAVARGLFKIGMDDKDVDRRVKDLTASLGSNDSSHERLAVLMSSTSLGNIAPRLELGVVLRTEVQQDDDPQDRDKAKTRYWLCIQPLCDSVRLDEQRAFPLLPTVKSKTADAMIHPPGETAIPVAFDRKPHRLLMVEFTPTDQQAVIADGDPSNWYFTADGGTRYQAVARLRPEVAAQVVHRLAAEASRTGVNSSEWLRRTDSRHPTTSA